VRAPAESVFGVYQAVDRWHEWDPDTRQACLHGPFRVGSRGKLTPTQGFPVPMRVTALNPGLSFTVESRIPFLRMRFDHELRTVFGVTRVVHRVTLSGLLTRFVGNGLARRIDQGLPATLANLKCMVEARSGFEDPQAWRKRREALPGHQRNVDPSASPPADNGRHVRAGR
jgi:hypothetical protein